MKKFISALGLFMASAATFAHHGWSGYDQNKTLTLTGEITESGYVHPHAYVKLETPEKTWIGVLAPPSRMEARGLPREMLKTGAKATLVGYPSRDNPEEMRAERIIIGSKTVELR
ncbi:MAG: DUF6152 family protein [Burkholderiales bacterium]